MHGSSKEIVAILTGASFAAGLNVYATLATLGLLARAQVIALPSALHPVESWWVIAIAIIMFGIEFVGDKIPAFDLIWNALHTFIRVPIAALLAYGAASHLSPVEQWGAAALGGTIAFAAHGGKTAARVAITPSPEPMSNFGLSAAEDAIAIFLTWFATQHPYITAAVVAVLVFVVILGIRFVWRSLRRLFRAAGAELDQERTVGLP